MAAPNDLRERVRGERGLFEKIESVIPGFAGYKEKELRREADKLLRTELAKELKLLDKEIDEAYEEIVDSKLTGAYGIMDTTTALMDKIISKVEIADYGYAGFFNAMKIKEGALGRMYDFDASLFGEMQKIEKAVGKLADDVAGDGANAERLAKELKAAVIEFDKKFDQRKGVMLDIE